MYNMPLPTKTDKVFGILFICFMAFCGAYTAHWQNEVEAQKAAGTYVPWQCESEPTRTDCPNG